MVWNRLEGTKAAYSIPSINDTDQDDDDNVDNNDNWSRSWWSEWLDLEGVEVAAPTLYLPANL